MTARRVPWWFSLAAGAASVAIGGYLIVDPVRRTASLTAAVGFALILAGAARLSTSGGTQRPWLVRAGGVCWIVGGVLALVLPGLTLRTLAVISGAALLLGGIAELRVALQESGEERLLSGIAAAAAVAGGALVLVWTSASLLALAVTVGVCTFLTGCAALAAATRPVRVPREVVVRGGRVIAAGSGATPRPIRRAFVVAALALALAGGAVSVVLHHHGPAHPGPFYAAPSPLPHGPPGTLIRYELIPGFYQGASTYRILYKSIGFDGRPIAVSGLVVVPEGPPPRGGRRIVAFTHGTVGVAQACAPSLQNVGGGQLIDGLGSFIAAGYVVAATDYEGLGTPGPDPYLIGRVEAMNALDSVRAAHRLRAAHAGVEFAIWGASQGGQAALFTAQLASSYAPGLRLAGVAAGAPVPDLVDLFKAGVKTAVGRLLIATALNAWGEIYGSSRTAAVLTPAGREAVAAVGRYCLYERELAASIPSATLADVALARQPPWGRQPWRSIRAEDTPGEAPIGVPILITQGGGDRVVTVRATARLVRRLCAHGETVEERVYPGVGHVETGIVVTPDVATWIAERFAGRPATSTCPG